MKYYFLLIPVLLIVVASSCKKDNPDVSVQDYHDSVSMKLNGQQWPIAFKTPIAIFRGQDKQLFNISIQKVMDDSLNNTQALVIGDLPLFPSSHTIYSSYYPGQNPTAEQGTKAVFLTIDNIIGGGSNWYTIMENDPSGNELSIDSYDPAKKIVKGHFHFSMRRTDSTQAPNLYGFPDTLRFTEGYFDMKIYKQN